MELFNPDFVLYFSYLLLLTLLAFVSGGIISRVLYVGKTTHFRIFVNLVVGYIFWIVLTALFFTKGNTIMLLIPVGFLFWKLLFDRKKTGFEYSLKSIIIDSKTLFKEMWFLLSIFILFAIKHIYAQGYIESDYLFFGNVSYAMKQSGMEGVNFGMFTSCIVHPYHYGDMWLTSFITEIFGTNYYLTNIFLSMPFLLFIVYSGTIALIKEIGIRFFEGGNLKYTYLYACLIIVIGGLDYFFVRKNMQGTIGLIQIPKTSIIYFIYIFTFMLLLRNKTKQAFFVILTLVALYTQTVFFVLSAIGVLILIMLIKERKTGLKYLSYYVAIISMLFLFYFFNSMHTDESSVVSFDQSKIIEGVYTYPLQLVKKSIRFVIIYLPFLLLFVIAIQKDKFRSVIHRLKKSKLFLIVLTFLLSGFLGALLFSRALFEVNQDYAQVLYNGFLPVMAILSLSAIVFALYDMNQRKDNYFQTKIALFVIILVGLSLQHHRDPRYWGHLTKIEVDKEFYNSLAQQVTDEDRIGTFQNFEPPTEVYWFQYNYQLYPNLRRIAYFRNNGVYYPECLNVHEMDTTKSEHRKYYYKKSPFIHFMDSLNTGENKTTANKAQYSFIKKHRFDYIILPENIKTPDLVKPIIIDSLVRNDGLRVYKLNTVKELNKGTQNISTL